jgi:hypothetical protein
LVSPHVKTSTINPLNDRIENIERDLGLTGSYTKNLLYATQDNASEIIDYIATMKYEVNYSNHYGNDTIRALCRFSNYLKNKPFKNISCKDLENRRRLNRVPNRLNPLQFLMPYKEGPLTSV